MDREKGRDGSWRAGFLRPEFWLFVLTCAGGFASNAWWIFVPLCVSGLSIVTLPKYLRLWPHCVEAGRQRAWLISVALSVLNSAGAAAAAFMLGVVVRWLMM